MAQQGMRWGGRWEGEWAGGGRDRTPPTRGRRDCLSRRHARAARRARPVPPIVHTAAASATPSTPVPFPHSVWRGRNFGGPPHPRARRAAPRPKHPPLPLFPARRGTAGSVSSARAGLLGGRPCVEAAHSPRRDRTALSLPPPPPSLPRLEADSRVVRSVPPSLPRPPPHAPPRPPRPLHRDWPLDSARRAPTGGGGGEEKKERAGEARGEGGRERGGR